MKYVIFSMSLMLFFSCQDDCSIIGTYQFEIPATLSPAKSIFNIGDTITVTSTFSDKVYDKTTERTYSLENYKFYPKTKFSRLDTTGIDTLEMVTTDHFEIIVGSEYEYNFRISNSGGALLEGQFNYENNVYDLQYKIVVKKPGLYVTGFGTLLSQFGDRQDFPGKCSREGVDTRTVLNEGTGNNAEFLLEAVSETWHNLYISRLESDFHGLGRYCFKVE